MYTLLVILIVIAAVLMIGIVLIQESKGGGLASNFSTYNQIGGVRKTTISIACAYVAPQASTEGSVMEGIENPTTNPNNLPGFGASQQKSEAPAAAPAQEAPAAPEKQ